MNATLFANVPPSRVGLMPNTDELIHYGWATAIVAQQVRAVGFAGSIVVPITIGNKGTDQLVYTASGVATLPYKAYGTLVPPAIFSCVQYGSNTYVYKTLVHKEARDWRFRTWISDLRVLNKVEGTLDVAAWTFQVNHYSDLAGAGYLNEPPIVRAGFVPPNPEFLSLNNTVQPTITLWWYAMGFDPNMPELGDWYYEAPLYAAGGGGEGVTGFLGGGPLGGGPLGGL